MVKDRETKMKETLKIMGCESWIYALSFMVQRGVWMFFPTFFVSLFIWLFNQEYLTFGTAAILFVMLWFFGMGMLGVAMLIQNFFRNSQLVPMVMPFIFFIPTGIAMTIVLGPVVDPTMTNQWI